VKNRYNVLEKVTFTQGHVITWGVHGDKCQSRYKQQTSRINLLFNHINIKYVPI